MKVLIIDNTLDRDCWGSEDLRRFVTTSGDRTAFVRRAPQGDLPSSLRGFDRVIVSGSRTSCLEEGDWIAREDELLREAVSTGKPLLGVCYGHQALNRAIGGRELLRKAAEPEYGWTQIEITERAPLFEGLPEKFWSFSSHYEEVATPAKGMKLLARSERCGVQACRYEDKPIYGIQFHPEKLLEDTAKSIAGWKKDPKRRKIILDERKGPKLYDAKVGERIFSNFLTEKA
jgi:GMP synthase (glutamine-hydrolysing)